MKQPRSERELLDSLDHEMAWRIKEIHELKSSVSSAGWASVNAHVRAGVSMLYAHWEGFIKNSANCYVSYLSHRADLGRDLLPCFVALSMRAKLAAAQASTKAAGSVDAVESLLNEMDKPIKLPRQGAISAESNLNSEVFVSIVTWIGLDISRYEARFNLIDQSLLAARNKIAHGEFIEVDALRFSSLVVDVLQMMRWFKTDIENAVVTKAFMKPVQAQAA